MKIYMHMLDYDTCCNALSNKADYWDPRYNEYAKKMETEAQKFRTADEYYQSRVKFYLYRTDLRY